MPKKKKSKPFGPQDTKLTEAEMRELARQHPARGVGEEGSFTLRDRSGHRIDPTTRERVPRGYDIATAHYPREEIVLFTPKLNRRKDDGDVEASEASEGAEPVNPKNSDTP